MPHFRWAVLAAFKSVLALLLACQTAAGQSISVTGGQQIGVLPGSTGSADWILVSGTADDPPTRSTYNLGGSLTLTTSAAVTTVNDFGILNVGMTGSITSAAGYAEVTTGGLFDVSGHASIADGVFVYDGGQVAIGSAGAIAGNMLYVAGASAFSRTAGGVYSVGTLSIAESASVNFTAGDSVSTDVLVDSAATLTLNADLAIPSGTLFLTGGGAVARSTQSINTAALDVGADSSLTILATDAFTNILLQGGGQVCAAAPLSVNSLTVTGSSTGVGPSSLTATAGLSVIDTGVITVSDGGLVSTPGGIIGDGGTMISVTGTGSRLVTGSADAIDGVAVAAGGVMEMLSGTVVASTLSLSGPGAFVRGGGGYDVMNLRLEGGSLDFTTADSVTADISVTDSATLVLLNGLSLSGNLVLDRGGALTRSAEAIAVGGLFIADSVAFALLVGDSIGVLDIANGSAVTTAAALSLSSLSIDGSGALLDVQAFDASAGQLRWGLSVAGDQRPILQGYLASGRIVTASTPQAVTAVYDLATYGNVTYVGYFVAVPEPSALATVAVGLAGVVLAKCVCRVR